MINKKILAVGVTGLWLFTGCAEVPSNVAEEVSVLDHSSRSGDSAAASPVSDESHSDQTILKKGKLPQIIAQTEYELNTEGSRFVIDSVRLPNAKDMPVCDVKVGGASFDSFYEICHLMFPNENTNKDSPNYSLNYGDAPIDKTAPAYEHPFEGDDGLLRSPNVSFMDYITFSPHANDIEYGAVQWDTGFIKGSQIGGNEYSHYYNFIPHDATERRNKPIRRYSREEAVKQNDSYIMVSGEEWPLTSAVEYIENQYNSMLSKTDILTFHYQVKEIDVINISDNQYGYYFLVEFTDEEGRYYDTCLKYTQKWIKKQIEENKPFPMENGGCAYCYEKNRIAYIEKGFTYSEIAPTTKNAEIISLGEATKTLDQLLAPSQVIHIPCVELNYVLICKGYPFLSKWGLTPQEDSAYASYYYSNLARRDCEFEIRPMWCFRSAEFTDLDYNLGNAYFVDAITGKVWVIRISSYMNETEAKNLDKILAYLNDEVN